VRCRLEALRKVDAEPCERAIEPGEELFGPPVEMLEIRQPAPASRDVDQLLVRRDGVLILEGSPLTGQTPAQTIDDADGLRLPASRQCRGAERHRPVEATLRRVLMRSERPGLLLIGVEMHTPRRQPARIGNEASRGADHPTVQAASLALEPDALAHPVPPGLRGSIQARADELEASQEILDLPHALAPVSRRLVGHRQFVSRGRSISR
jgi:hypothetical protein